MPLNIAVIASGDGSNFQAIVEKVHAGFLDVAVRVLICNRPGAGVIARAQAFGIPCVLLDHEDKSRFSDRVSFDQAMIEAIRQYGADWVVLAGYMRLLTPEFLNAFPDRVLNIHPTLLPSFPGLHGCADALAYGVKIAGATVHFVEEAVDSGPVIIQAAIPIAPGDTLGSITRRIHEIEHRIYPQALQWIATGRLTRMRDNSRTIVIHPAMHSRGYEEPCCLISPPLEEGF